MLPKIALGTILDENGNFHKQVLSTEGNTNLDTNN